MRLLRMFLSHLFFGARSTGGRYRDFKLRMGLTCTGDNQNLAREGRKPSF